MDQKRVLIEKYKIFSELQQNSLDRYMRAKIFCAFSIIGLMLFSILFRFSFMVGVMDFTLVCLWNIFFYISIGLMIFIVFSDIKYRKKSIQKREQILHKIEEKLGWSFENE